MELSETEILYSPTRWSKRYPADKVIEEHIKFAKEVSNKNKKEIPCQLNVSYGPKEKQKYDIFGTDLPDDAPIFIYIHGGYWQELDRDYSSYVVEPFYKNNIKTFVFGYTLCPAVTIYELLQEIQQALTSTIHYARKNKSKDIFISGYSAGSQIIAYMFKNYFPTLPEDDRQLFKAAILCCGVYDLSPLIDTYINKALKLNFETAKDLSPLHNEIDKLEMIVYIVVGSDDSPAFIKQSQLYYDKIKLLGDVRFKIIENVDHFSIVERFSCQDYELVKFVDDIKSCL